MTTKKPKQKAAERDAEQEFPLPQEPKEGSSRTALNWSDRRSASRELVRAKEFLPDEQMERIKARFFRRAEELQFKYDVQTILKHPDLIMQCAGNKKIFEWWEKPGFAEWFIDGDYFADLIQAKRSKVVKMLDDIIESSVSLDADRIKAGRIFLDLAGAFPNKKQEVRFIDESLNNMPMPQVEAEKARLTAMLGEEDDEGEDETSEAD